MLAKPLIEYEIPVRSADAPRNAPETEPEQPVPQNPPIPKRFVDDKVLPVIAPVPATANDWALNIP